MFELTMLPAREGDCLLLTYGKPDKPQRVLIDGGRSASYVEVRSLLTQLPAEQRILELLVVTHIDRDHIEGVLAMLEDKERPVQFRDVWFNGYDHLHGKTIEGFGPVQGERLTKAIVDQHLPWNLAFEGNSVEFRNNVHAIELSGGLRIILILSPSRVKLEALIGEWEKICKEEGLIPGASTRRDEPPKGLEGFGGFSVEKAAAEPFQRDTSKPNGSSIAMLVEYEDKRLLLTGDAHVDVLTASLKHLAQLEGGKIRLDAFKLSHHGSDGNTSRELLDMISCDKYLVSTNGSVHHHPDRRALARIAHFCKGNKEFVFNYDTSETRFWDSPTWKQKFNYRTRYPVPETNGTMKIVF